MTGVNENLSLVHNDPNQINLRAFQIDGLFGRYNVRLDLEKTANIFIGENGLGKTTILRCLYFALTEDYSMLREIPFEEISVFFKNGENCSISKDDLLKESSRNRTTSIASFPDNVIDSIIYNWLEKRNFNPRYISEMSMGRLYRFAEEIADQYDIPFPIVQEHFRELQYLSREGVSRRKSNRGSKIDLFREKIRKYVPENIVYLPTYRRIENSPSNLRYEEDESYRSLIHFGMKDVQKSIDAVLNKIRTQTMQGYNNMASILLKEYSEGNQGVESSTERPIDFQTAEIVLDRLGNEIDSECKGNIQQIIRNGRIYEEEFAHLRNLLQRLINNYKKLEAYDDRINNFSNTCNRYLNDKTFLYNPSNLTVSVCMSDILDESISLHQLSSGEKQIVSLFSMLYLSDMNDKPMSRRVKQPTRSAGNIIMIDEPELSLSIDWQRRLLPDIIRSGNCNMLLAVTHSPFIFENEFDMDAKEIRRILQ